MTANIPTVGFTSLDAVSKLEFYVWHCDQQQQIQVSDRYVYLIEEVIAMKVF